MAGTGAITLVLGGARSGKSEVAEGRARSLGVTVVFVATGSAPDRLDPAWTRRVAAHRTRRPVGWPTVELGPGGDLAGVLAERELPVLVDSLGTWLAGCAGFEPDAPGLVEALSTRRRLGRATVMVTDEVGLGVHPSTAVGGEFRDALGQLNRRVAEVSDQVLLVVAGRVLPLQPGPVQQVW